MEKRERNVVEKNLRRVVIAAMVLLFIALGKVAFAKVNTLATEAPFWVEDEAGTSFDFAGYIDAMGGECEFSNLGNPKKGFYYTEFYFGVGGNRSGTIEASYLDGRFCLSSLKMSQADGTELEIPAMANEFAETIAIVEGMEGDIVLTHEQFEQFVKFTSTTTATSSN